MGCSSGSGETRFQPRGVLVAIACALLAFGLAATMAQGARSAWADEPTNTFDANAEKPTISTAADMTAFAKAVNDGTTFDGKTVELAQDIDLTNVSDWHAVGNDDKQFTGTFDGKKHNIQVNIDSSDDYVGVFGSIGGNAVVKNFTVSGTVKGGVQKSGDAETGAHFVAGAVAYADGKAHIVNVGNDANVTGTREWHNGDPSSTAGILSYTGAQGTETADQRVNAIEVTGCYNKGTISSAGFAGGILGCSAYGYYFAADPVVTSCYNVGAVSSSSSGQPASGIVGVAHKSLPVWVQDQSVSVYVRNCLDAGRYATNYYQRYFCGMSPHSVTAEQANYYRTPIDGGYFFSYWDDPPENFNGVTDDQLSGKAEYNGGRLVDAMNTTVAKDAGVQWLPGARIKQDVPCLDWEAAEVPGLPVIMKDPAPAANAHGVTNTSGVELSVVAMLPTDANDPGHEGTLTYEWYEATVPSNPNPDSDKKVSGDNPLTDSTFTTPNDAAAGQHSYYCVVTNTFGDSLKATAVSQVATVTYLVAEPQKPTISEQPKSIEGEKSQLDDISFSVQASVADGGDLSYQWYSYVVTSVDDDENKSYGWVKVDEANATATQATFKPSGLTLGGNLFRCEITNTVDGIVSEKATTGQVSVNVVPVEVKDLADLRKLRTAVNDGTFGAGTAKLVGDAQGKIDLSNEAKWTPIGTAEHPFEGTLTTAEGAHVTLTGLNIDAETANAALFGYVRGATLENFTVQGAVKSSQLNVAGVVAHNLADGTLKISNVGNEASVTTSKESSPNSSTSGVGGLVAYSVGALQISGCYNKGAIESTQNGVNFGGLVGYLAANDSKIVDSYNVGAITLGGSNDTYYDTYVGGIVGQSHYAMTVEGCYNTGVITMYNYSGWYASSRYGGIAGSLGDSSKSVDNYFLGISEAFKYNSHGGSRLGPKGFGLATGATPPTSMTTPAEAQGLQARNAYEFARVPRENGGYPRLKWEAPYDAPNYAITFAVTGNDDGKSLSPKIVVNDADGNAVDSQSDGVYRLPEDQFFTYTLSADGYADVEGSFTADDEKTIAVVMERNYKVTFKVTEKGSGERIADAAITVSADGAAVTPDAEGRYLLKHGVEYSYTVSKAGYDTATGTLKPSADDEIAVELEKAVYTITFAAVDKDGKAVEGFTVAVKQGDEAVDPQADGTYKLSGAIAYTYTVKAEGYQTATGTLTPTAAGTFDVRLTSLGTVLTVQDQYGNVKEYKQADLSKLAAGKNGNASTKMQTGTEKVRAAKKDGYVKLDDLLEDAKAPSLATGGYEIEFWAGGSKVAPAGSWTDTTYEALAKMGNFYPNVSKSKPNNANGAQEMPFALAWAVYEQAYSGDKSAAVVADEALAGTPIETSGLSTIAGAWVEDDAIQSPGWRSVDGITGIVVKRTDRVMLTVEDHKGKETQFKLSDLQKMATQNTDSIAMQYAGGSGGTVKVAKADSYVTLDALFKEAGVTWESGYELWIYDAVGVYAPGDKWTEDYTTFEGISAMKYFYPRATVNSSSTVNAVEVPFSIAWSTHSQAWSGNDTAEAARQAALTGPAVDEFRIIAGGWYDPAVGRIMVPGWRSANNVARIAVKEVNPIDKAALRATIAEAEADLESIVVADDASALKPGTEYVSQETADTLKKAIADARSVADSYSATQAQIGQANRTLKVAKTKFDSGRQTASVDKSALIAAIKAAQDDMDATVTAENAALVAKGAAYATPAAKARLKAAIDAAQAVVDNAEATQAETNKAQGDVSLAKSAFDDGKGTGTKSEAVTPSPSTPSTSATPAAATTTPSKAASATSAKKSIAKAKVTARAQAYTGKALKPAPTVKLAGKTLKKGTDYTVSYKANRAVGTATVTVTGKGSYTGTAKGTFAINPKAPKATKAAGSAKAVKLTWKASVGAGGYQVAVAADKKFTSGKRTATAAGAKATSKKVSKLKAGKTYYAKVRAFKKVGKKTYYSAWSNVKTAKTPAAKAAKAKRAMKAASVSL